MSLPSLWVDKVFEKLTLAYGRDFLDRWRDLDMEKVKADWAHELAGYENAPYAISYALQNLPATKPPNVFEFRNIARCAPPPPVPRLEAPPANKKVAMAAIAEARALLRRAAS